MSDSQLTPGYQRTLRNGTHRGRAISFGWPLLPLVALLACAGTALERAGQVARPLMRTR